jgi:hypothetical protein
MDMSIDHRPIQVIIPISDHKQIRWTPPKKKTRSIRDPQKYGAALAKPSIQTHHG